MKLRVDELIDAHGGILPAIENRKTTIERRKSAGKSSPRAEAELAALESLSLDYCTDKGAARPDSLEPDYL